MTAPKDTFDLDKFLKESQDSTLKNSKLFELYKYLDDLILKNIPSTKCVNKKEGISLQLCQRIENIFNEWESILSSRTEIKSKCCDYFIYWLYGKIAENKLSIYDSFGLYKRVSEILKKESPIINENKCEDKFKRETSLDVLKNKKVLHDFVENYDYINDNWSRIRRSKPQKYCNYISHIFNLYHTLEEEDRPKGLSKKYEKELNLFKNKFNDENVLSSLKEKCNIDDLILKSLKRDESVNLLRGNDETVLSINNRNPRYDDNFTSIKNDYDDVLKELPSYSLYNSFNNNDTKTYNITHCNTFSDDKVKIKNICKQIVINLNELPDKTSTNVKSHKDRCLHLNFWIYEKLDEIYKNETRRLLDIPEVYELLKADSNINNDLIKKDFDKNYYSEVTKNLPPKKNVTAVSYDKGENNATYNLHEITKGLVPPVISTETSLENLPAKPDPPFNIVVHKELSKYNPCIFNIDCKFFECREMKHLYEYFKNYNEIKTKIKCEKGEDSKYNTYLNYISSLYNKHIEEEGCCSWGAEMCPDYFLECDEAYDPQKLITAINSAEKSECTKLKESAGVIKHPEEMSEEDKLRNAMYIKHLECSYVPGTEFENKILRCKQKSQRKLFTNKFSSIYTSYKPRTNTTELISKNITINGKPINVVLLSDPNKKIRGEKAKVFNRVDSKKVSSGYYSALFPEVTDNARDYYLEEAEKAEKACKNGTIKEGMEEYCRRSKEYNDIINGANYETEEHVQENTDMAFDNDEDSFTVPITLYDILKELPFRIGVVVLAALGTIAMLFFYYKFTPLGTWIQNIGGKKKRNRDIHREHARQALNYAAQYVPQNAPRQRIQIAYHNSQ
ncbi:PIR protein [Plasmodium vivax]|uniref:VIR protein n=1 Tax=Plasmodium vivax TaxID=5855 RepID=A0A564ZPN4_PLAVI|nr:PIR protein [Plasmodium vivax]